MKHTPGPWRRGKNADLWIYSHGIENRLIAKVCSNGANANLIAAAPELLEALQGLYLHIHEEGMERGELSPFKFAWLKCEAAIRKAEAQGKEPRK